MYKVLHRNHGNSASITFHCCCHVYLTCMLTVLFIPGDHRFSFNVWEHLITPSLDNDPTLYSNPAYDGCDGPAATASREKHTHAPGKRPSLYYDVASIINPLAYEHYEMIDNENHYEMASDFDMPALPYEIPTLSVSV